MAFCFCLQPITTAANHRQGSTSLHLDGAAYCAFRRLQSKTTEGAQALFMKGEVVMAVSSVTAAVSDQIAVVDRSLCGRRDSFGDR